MIESLITVLNNNILLGILVALIAGFISSFSPCSLSTLPLIIGYVGTECEDCKSKKAWGYSIMFALGLAITFVCLGMFSVFLGDKLKVFGSLWYFILAAILIYVTLQLFGVLSHKSEHHCHKKPILRRSALGAFFLGILGGVFDSPCGAPALAVILTYTSTQSNLLLRSNTYDCILFRP